jgi:hypothetical protein
MSLVVEAGVAYQGSWVQQINDRHMFDLLSTVVTGHLSSDMCFSFRWQALISVAIGIPRVLARCIQVLLGMLHDGCFMPST